MNQIQQANMMKQMNTAINMRNQVYAQDMQNSGYSMQAIQVQNMEAMFKQKQEKIYVLAARKKAKKEKEKKKNESSESEIVPSSSTQEAEPLDATTGIFLSPDEVLMT